jgi:ubiquinone/menaquinone biosynthesis C-methylase UbiE
MTDEEHYLLAEWEMFRRDPSRRAATLNVTAGERVERVLDVGCGAGQELLPLITERRAVGVGIDVSAVAGEMARRHFPDSAFFFVRGAAERLPFRPECFDVVICRVALPLFDQQASLDEMARVLRPGGLLLLKIHSPWLGARYLWRGIREGRAGAGSYSLRVLRASVRYALTGETTYHGGIPVMLCTTRGKLRRELNRRGLATAFEMPDSTRVAPSFAIRKLPLAAQRGE